jgi:hypothetical protein
MDTVTLLPVIVPTRSEQGAIGRTVALLWSVLYKMGYEPMYVHACAHGYALVRTLCFKEAQKKLNGVKVARGMLLDDDVLINNAQQLYDVLHYADKNDLNIVAPLMMATGKWTYVHEPVPKDNDKFEMYTSEDIDKLKPYDKLWAAGLGFYYGTLPLDYTFHSDKPYQGEDINFFRENDLDVRHAELRLYHAKTILL